MFCIMFGTRYQQFSRCWKCSLVLNYFQDHYVEASIDEKCVFLVVLNISQNSPQVIYCDSDWNLCLQSVKCQGKVREFFSANPVATLCNSGKDQSLKDELVLDPYWLKMIKDWQGIIKICSVGRNCINNFITGPEWHMCCLNWTPGMLWSRNSMGWLVKMRCYVKTLKSYPPLGLRNQPNRRKSWILTTSSFRLLLFKM